MRQRSWPELPRSDDRAPPSAFAATEPRQCHRADQGGAVSCPWPAERWTRAAVRSAFSGSAASSARAEPTSFSVTASASCACSASRRGALPTSKRLGRVCRPRRRLPQLVGDHQAPFGDDPSVRPAAPEFDIEDGGRQLGFAGLERRRATAIRAFAFRQAQRGTQAPGTASAFPFRAPRASGLGRSPATSCPPHQSRGGGGQPDMDWR